MINIFVKQEPFSSFLCNFGAVKYTHIAICLLLLCLVSVGHVQARESKDSLVLNRVFSYQRNYTRNVSGFSTNFYCKFVYQVHKRNSGLFLIPHMYTIAHGKRIFLSEQYGRLHFYDLDDYEHESQVYYTTIPRNRRTMPVLTELMTPSLYSVLIYGDHVLSPFHRDNRRYYHYTVISLDNGHVRLFYRPRHVSNTQLVRGVATVDEETGRIIDATFDGEYDMIHYRTMATMGDDGSRSLLPTYCRSDISFKFLGNHITSNFEALFDCPIRLSDTINVRGNRTLIDSVRPISLTQEEQALYKPEQKPDTTIAIAKPDSTPQPKHHHNYLKEIGWHIIGEHLIRSHLAQSENFSFKLSPIIAPQYVSFGSKGMSYKMKFSAVYNPTPSASLYFTPTLGFNFKIRQFYYSAPLRFVYNKQTGSYAQLLWRNGNRINSSTVIDEIADQQGDVPLVMPNMNRFNDEEWNLYNNIQLSQKLRIETGIVYHRRRAINPVGMRYYGKPTVFRSLAPALGIKLRPWPKGPLFSIDYERGIKTHKISVDYERLEADLSHKHHITSLRTLNLRMGGGIYTRRKQGYFLDFANFRDNNLPEGWNDDWTGEFQLLSSRLYNQSRYYARSNISYESPLLMVALLPVLGRYVEQERFYWSGLLINHYRPYSELGYGFTTRYFSMGIFASFHNLEFQRIGTKFTIELFDRW